MKLEPDAPPQKLDSTLAKGIQILEALTQSKAPKGVSELSRELGLTKSNVFRLLQTLLALGYVRSTDDRLYCATLKTWQVGRSVVENLNLRELAAPAMQALSAKTKETIYLAVLEGLHVIYIDKIESMQPIRSWNMIGGAAPVHCVGTGKAILAQQYDRMRERLVGNLTKFTDLTITSIKEMDAEMATTIGRGVAIDRGEYREKIRSYGAPIFMPDGSVAGALGVSVPEVNLEPGDEDAICAALPIAADNVSERLAAI